MNPENRNVCGTAEGGRVMFWCPGCQMYHAVRTQRPEDDPGSMWSWNGSLEKPTFSPSVLVRGTVPVTEEEVDKIMRGEPFEPVPFRCHSYVREGRIEFLTDCTHALAGQTVPMEPWE